MKALLILLTFLVTACGQSQADYDTQMTSFCSHASKAEYCANYDSCSKYFPINNTNNSVGFSCSN